MLQDELLSRGIDWVTNYYPYENPVPVNSEKFEKVLISHVRKGSKVAIFPDSDIDGFFSALEMFSLCELLGFKEIYILKITHKAHGLDSGFIDQVLDCGADLLITVDSTTNNRSAIEKLSMFGVDHLIVDHHMISEDLTTYPENVTVVNSKDVGNESFSCVSAGMLCYILIHNLLNKIKIDKVRKNSFLNKMYVLGYMTLYTDCMNLADEYNLSVINNIEPKKNFAPKCVTQFMTQYDDLNRNFIEYKFGPRVNSLIRRERFDIVYDLLFRKISPEEREHLLALTEAYYEDGKAAIEKIVASLKFEYHDMYVFANLDMMEFDNDLQNIIKNYTGLIANKYTELFGKLAVVVATDRTESYKGSVRDPYSRQALRLFETFSDCGGHMSAFGLHLLKKDLASFKRQLEMLSPILKNGITESQIILDGDEFDDRLPYYIRSIAEYNEVSGNTIPKAVIRKKLGHSQRVSRFDKYSKVKWEGVDIVSFSQLHIGETVLITPTIGKNGVTCFATIDNEQSFNKLSKSS